MPTTHNIKTWVVVASVLLIFAGGIGIIILVIYILLRLSQPATACSYCEGDTFPAPMPFSPMALPYAPAPPYGYNPYPAPAGWPQAPGARPCPYCYQPVPVDNRYCPGCGRGI